MEDNIFEILANSSKRVAILGLKPEYVYQDDGTLLRKDGKVFYDSTEESTVDACFVSFDYNQNQYLSWDEFYCLLEQLFRDKKGNAQMMDDIKKKTIFEIFDKSGDELINKEEFLYCWKSWIKKVIRYKTQYN